MKIDAPRTASEENGTPHRMLAVILCATCAVGLHAMLPMTAALLSQAEPSYAGRLFSWVGIPTKQTLAEAQAAAGSWRIFGPFAIICASLFTVYGVMLRLVRGNQSNAIQVLVFASGAISLLGYLFAPVMLSTDVYAYTIYGRVLSVYGANPYNEHPPISPSDPYVPLYGLEYQSSWYGPLWTLISAGVALLTGENVGLTVLAFRGLAAISALLTAGLIWSSLRKISPEHATQGLVFFLWNPLLVIETGLSGHNDATMMSFVMLGVWLHLRGWKAGAIVAFTLSALVKFLTGMLVPLYVLMVLRETAGSRGRMAFLVRGSLAAGSVAIAAFLFANTGSDVPAAHSATAPDFYSNNFHELIFKRIRRVLGEDAESINIPIYFSAYWLQLKNDAVLHTDADPAADAIRTVSAGERVLLVAPYTSNWVRVYDPIVRRKGCIYNPPFTEASRPALADGDATARQLEHLPTEWPTVRKANTWVRLVTWVAFMAFGLLAAWRTRNFSEFLVWAAASLLASYYLIITEIWPWYVNWALALSAMAPGRLPAKLAMILSACVLTLYVTITYQGSDPPWVYTWRSVPAFVLPLAVFGIVCFIGSRQPPSHVHSN